MDKVYCVFQGEQYDNERLVSVHASLEGAKDAARELAHSDDAREDGIVYSTAKEGTYEHGSFWKAPFSGHFIAVQAKSLGR